LLKGGGREKKKEKTKGIQKGPFSRGGDRARTREKRSLLWGKEKKKKHSEAKGGGSSNRFRGLLLLGRQLQGGGKKVVLSALLENIDGKRKSSPAERTVKE